MPDKDCVQECDRKCGGCAEYSTCHTAACALYVKGELAMVDEALARTPAIAAITGRYEKIRFALATLSKMARGANQ